MIGVVVASKFIFWSRVWFRCDSSVDYFLSRLAPILSACNVVIDHL